jgi:hypothetical protein
MGHADLSTQEFADDPGDGSTTHDGERVTAVGGDDAVLWLNGIFQTDRNGFLSKSSIQGSKMSTSKGFIVYLSDSQMAEAANHLGLVEGIGGLFHTAHRGHLLVNVQQLDLGHLHLEFGWIALVGAIRVFMDFDLERLRRVGGRFME